MGWKPKWACTCLQFHEAYLSLATVTELWQALMTCFCFAFSDVGNVFDCVSSSVCLCVCVCVRWRERELKNFILQRL